jgi:hypothetical protein
VKKTSSATESAQKSGAQDEAKGMPRPDATAPSPGAVGKGGDPSKEEPVAKATAQPEPEAHAES